MNHPIPIGSGIDRERSLCVPWGDTITVTFDAEADILYTQSPIFPPAFLPFVPSGQFYTGDVIGPRTAQQVNAVATLYFRLSLSGETGSVAIEVTRNC
jgi:hypothetical protein